MTQLSSYIRIMSTQSEHCTQKPSRNLINRSNILKRWSNPNAPRPIKNTAPGNALQLARASRARSIARASASRYFDAHPGTVGIPAAAAITRHSERYIRRAIRLGYLRATLIDSPSRARVYRITGKDLLAFLEGPEMPADPVRSAAYERAKERRARAGREGVAGDAELLGTHDGSVTQSGDVAEKNKSGNPA